MIFGSVISIFVFGITMNYEDFVPDLTHASNLFANTVFIFVVHHSIAGIVKPVRPQISLYRIIFNSFALGCTVLWVESFLAALAFADVKNPNWNEFPWEIQSLYNENFTSVPIIGQIWNFYPALNVAAVPILTITLRNNFFVMFGITKKSETPMKKALWSFRLSIPVFIIACVFKNPQLIMTYTDGIGGAGIMFIIPWAMIIFARRSKVIEMYSQENFNKTIFQHKIWPIIALIMAAITIWVTIYGIINKQAGE